MPRFKSLMFIVSCIVVILAAIQLSWQPAYAIPDDCNYWCVACTGPLCEGTNWLGQRCGRFVGTNYPCKYTDQQGRVHPTNCIEWCCDWLPCYTR